MNTANEVGCVELQLHDSRSSEYGGWLEKCALRLSDRRKKVHSFSLWHFKSRTSLIFFACTVNCFHKQIVNSLCQLAFVCCLVSSSTADDYFNCWFTLLVCQERAPLYSWPEAHKFCFVRLFVCLFVFLSLSQLCDFMLRNLLHCVVPKSAWRHQECVV